MVGLCLPLSGRIPHASRRRELARANKSDRPVRWGIDNPTCQAGSKAFPQGLLVAHGDDVRDPRRGRRVRQALHYRVVFRQRNRGPHVQDVALLSSRHASIRPLALARSIRATETSCRAPGAVAAFLAGTESTGPGLVHMAERRAAVRRCCTFLPVLPRVRLAVPEPADRGARSVPRSCRYLFRLGAAGHSGCDARGDVHYWRSRITVRTSNNVRESHSACEPRVGPAVPLRSPPTRGRASPRRPPPASR